MIILKNARVFDGVNNECAEGMTVVVEGGSIKDVTSTPITSISDAQVIDVGRRTLMPGLIDAHIHAYACDVNFHNVDRAGEAYRTAHAARMLNFALRCGFTTVRDIGGGDYGLYRALEDRLIIGPRFFYAGKILSMTGGHGDFRAVSESEHNHGYCSCGSFNTLAVIADGVDECVKAVREELRRGAHCIKIMASGGIASPADPIWMQQYREDEIRAIVNETNERRTYTSAHCHPANATRRCVELGVRVIEHATLIDTETAQYVAEKGAFVIPTLAVIFALAEHGAALGFPAVNQRKAEYACASAITGLDAMRRAGVKVGFGTDLLGETYDQQCREFMLRSEVFTPFEILKQATSVNADVLLHRDLLGCVKPGAYADLLVVDGDPLSDISLLSHSGRNIRLVMRAGEIVRNELK